MFGLSGRNAGWVRLVLHPKLRLRLTDLRVMDIDEYITLQAALDLIDAKVRLY